MLGQKYMIVLDSDMDQKYFEWKSETSNRPMNSKQYHQTTHQEFE